MGRTSSVWVGGAGGRAVERARGIELDRVVYLTRLVLMGVTALTTPVCTILMVGSRPLLLGGLLCLLVRGQREHLL